MPSAAWPIRVKMLCPRSDTEVEEAEALDEEQEEGGDGEQGHRFGLKSLRR